ncbi:phage tail protein, partial [Escherichia coli]|nr:phage tail protein [Escherichia coli]
MSMVARTNPGPAEDDITDTDDGDTRISAGAFWPDIVLRELRLAVRLPGRVTTSRLLHTATGAVAHVTRELEAWQQEQQAAGHQTLADVPAAAPDGKPVRLTHMAVGDGGGTLPTPDSKQTRLVHEVWRHTVNRVILDATHQNRIIAELVIPPETGGFWIREIGVFDEHGDLIAVGNTAESYKPAVAEGSGRAQTFRTILTVSSTATVALTVDNTMVMATVDYVDDKLKEHEQSRRHPDASLTAKGFVQLSSATNSVSETQAATPKAVKAAYDLANGKYTAQDATTARKGLVQLSSATNSTSETLAATPKAVKAAYDNAEKRLQKDQNGGDIPDKGTFLNNINAVSKTDFAAKRGMRYVRVNAPAGAISGKYYPVVV